MDEAGRPSRDELVELTLAQATEYAIIFLDPQGRILEWLAGAEQIFGYEAAQVLGRDSSLLFTPEDVQRGIPQLELEIASRTGQAKDDRWLVRQDKARIWADGITHALRNEAGKVVGFSKILRNRTDQKSYIEALKNRGEGLEKADERRQRFLGTLAHEIRNTLAPLANAVELVQLGSSNQPDLAFATSLIRRQVDFIKRLVDDLLDLTRLTTGKVQLQKDRVELAELLRDVTDSVRPEVEARRQLIALILPPTPIWIQADRSRLHQVFTNLVTNASKYTDEGGRIWVKATVEGQDAVVRVADNGMGISADMLPRIFEMFTQEESARSKAPGGLGIGLAVVKDLVSLHGGQVLVNSDGPNKGSEFTVRLPLEQA